MADSITFTDVVSSLSGSPLSGGGTAAFKIRPTEGFFVPPTFVPADTADDAPVTLISARGAAGKTSTANALSTQLRAPVWRLEEDTTVSDASVHSLLVKHLGQVEPNAVLTSMDRPLMIIDSLDEARTRVSATSWNEFIRALGAVTNTGLRLVLLGRTRVIEDLWATFGDMNVTVSWYELSHFANTEIPVYIDNRSRLKDSTIDTKNPAYSAAKQSIIDALMEPVGTEQPERFVGYPPVLDAVSELLIKGANYQTVKNDFTSSNFANRVQVLESIIERILRREVEKVVPLLGDLHIESAYSPDEQMRWLVHDISDGPAPDLGFIPDVATRAVYEERIREFRAEHPFRNNSSWSSPIFHAYVVAKLFDVAPTALMYEAGSESGILFEFVCASHPEPLILSETQFAALHASLIAGQWSDPDVAVAVAEVDDEFEVRFIQGHNKAVSESIDGIVDSRIRGELSIVGPLTELSISINGTITIPKRVGDIELGPDLSLRADKIIIDGDRLAFGRRKDSYGPADISIQAENELTLPQGFVSPLPPIDVLEIVVPPELPLRHPWINYRSDSTTQIDDIDERAVRFLSKLMSLTRSHGHDGDRAVFSKKFEGRQGLRPEKFAAAVEILKKHGVIYVAGDMIYVSSHWEQHRFDGKSSPGQRHLDDCIEAWRPVLVEITDIL